MTDRTDTGYDSLLAQAGRVPTQAAQQEAGRAVDTRSCASPGPRKPASISGGPSGQTRRSPLNTPNRSQASATRSWSGMRPSRRYGSTSSTPGRKA
jgi:hypothetical protein